MLSISLSEPIGQELLLPKVWFSCGMQHCIGRGTGCYNRADSYFDNCLQALKESEIAWFVFLINSLEHNTSVRRELRVPWLGWADCPLCALLPERRDRRDLYHGSLAARDS